MNNLEQETEKKPKSNKLLKPLLIVFVVATLLVIAHKFNAQQLLINALDWIKTLGPWGPIAFIIIYILATVFFLPGSLLTLGAGLLFGPIFGSIYVSVASTIGATCAFLVGRYLARGWVSKQIEGNENFKAIDEAVADEGWKIVGLTRLSPIFPFNLLNYAFGVTQVSLRDYFFASWIGMMPGTVMYVYLGSLAGSLATLGTEGGTRTTAEWILYGIGLIATVAVTVYVTKIARKALQKKIS
ncbi:MAG: TVP38/TMEM64 family protein [Okeania sp. SIO2G4]|uniref:TVP38/TMEM64 family protein n=1 Tax=unclassified Okeania TaxID=2634635 RepID=UPI0013B607B5|nr:MULTISPECIES: TVP38/TMEM64 family protein [unclassified Okeania]NEP04870.1 TVP38/TMEM64 family protein [Okeania sp. SIO4D6]NEP38160.1 TVP38/TMEM64 family protein [Okeania sp. SIO2H7]NEP74336.1 TVP38/TMEM64 family protein [Okeania sp. SIO2G5]NEP95412.1 TVP38/TMEM64 family protein [Okeania sp. SIO2F5]NEQ93073.1 TVP38/TMEM64 family protein [Okeania sp. SIO2G4]